MRTIPWPLLAGAVIGSFTLFCAGATAQDTAKESTPAPYKVGDTMKDVKVTTLDGKEVNLLEYTKGKATVVNFFFKA